MPTGRWNVKQIRILYMIGWAIVVLYGCTSSTESTAIPEIIAINPTTGPPGAIVTIMGNGFSETASGNTITFNGREAAVLSASSDSVITRVPDNATSGPIKLVVDGQMATGPNFTVTSATGTLEITASTTGADLDPDGYTAILSSTGDQRSLGTQGTILIDNIPEGNHLLEISGIAENCTLQMANPSSFTISGNETEKITLPVRCDRIPRIAFSSTRTGNAEVWKIKSNGDMPVNLSNNPASDSRPFWSPDGTKLAFLSYQNGVGNIEIWVMNPDGSDQKQLTNNPSGEVFAPMWSPDGSQIVFANNRSGNFEIRRVDANGTNPARLTNDPGTDSNPCWSPDGSSIAFVSNRTGNRDIWVMNPDGTNQTQRTHHTAFDGNPIWAPEGTKIIFESERTGNRDIWMMDRDGTNLKNLTNAPGIDHFPRLSPDGARITFRSNRTGNFEIWVMDVHGSNPTMLTDNPATDVDSRWSPDGKSISFLSDRTGNFQIFVMNADGTNLRQLTTSPEGNVNHVWQPQP